LHKFGKAIKKMKPFSSKLRIMNKIVNLFITNLKTMLKFICIEYKIPQKFLLNLISNSNSEEM